MPNKMGGSRTRAGKASLAVRSGEDVWNATEQKSVRAELEADRVRLSEELNQTTQDLAELLRDGVGGAGNDEADVGSSSLERDSELSLAANQRDLLAQTARALLRLDDGTYGDCELCAEPIGKMRLMAFPRATLCMTCKQREERR